MEILTENYEDVFDYYIFDHDKHMFSGRSGKQRSKREVAVHTNRSDPCGHSRKISIKFKNTEILKRRKMRNSERRAQRKYSRRICS